MDQTSEHKADMKRDCAGGGIGIVAGETCGLKPLSTAMPARFEKDTRYISAVNYEVPSSRMLSYERDASSLCERHSGLRGWGAGA